MRCRKLHHRYTLFVTEGRFQLVSQEWHRDQSSFTAADTVWRPATDIYETEQSIIVTVELAGLTTDAIDIALYEDALVIQGHRQLPCTSHHGLYHVAEIKQGPFCLEVLLTVKVNPDQLEAKYNEGILTICLFKGGES